ncbi:short-chain dehydrogenase/reductase SDR [Caenispirillum salinarum AK4]|uniref:Short-chain dehydrogenase/reductase SDR n=1 Tax=Caenispirillum salinarum AK4 TaxID=1238182 RepID=K9GXN5_9PROT|nr:SDR family oxidoreductase [Caenispirillum salinarum]EKV30027.1 short-chain dehydrogenase/reductase SDR [Caenispirillum salinarum AK4]
MTMGRIRLRPLRAQVMVITGATSGIGLATAMRAADAGARLVLAARNREPLERIAEVLRNKGHEARAVVCDVGNEDQVRHLEATAVDTFGRVDTWVNNAGISAYGTLADIPLAEQRRIFETDFWGVVHGSLAAARVMRRQEGGVIVNVGSVLSDRAIPLQVPYAAAKHAVKGFTDGLRMELLREGAPISVTLIKPTSIDTPYKDHAAAHLTREPTNPPPVYDADLVADAILHAATHRTRVLSVGGGARLMTLTRHLFPGLSDLVGAKVFGDLQVTDVPRGGGGRHQGLFRPVGRGRVHNTSEAYVRRFSTYLFWQKHKTSIFVGLLAAAGLAWLANRECERRERERHRSRWHLPRRRRKHRRRRLW